MNATYTAMRAYQRARMFRARMRRSVRDWQGVRILGYHRLSAVPDSLCVTPAAFERQIEAVVAAGMTPIRLEDALTLLDAPVEGRFVCVTFDDGYEDNVEHGEPVLSALGIPATMYLPTHYIDGDLRFEWYSDSPAALGWDDVRAAAGRGVWDFQAHSRTHPWLNTLDDDAAWAEIAGSKADIEAQLGSSLTSFAYPAGMHGRREAEFVRRAGYRAAVTARAGVNTGADGSLARLHRTLVFREDSDSDFAAKISGLLDGPSRMRTAYHALLVARARRSRRTSVEMPRQRTAQ